ncbi:MAG: ribosomal protein S18-alanine N-acetyltransferase [Woeseiaceae bacterium]|nr:ribosomal protein S18-alanine N-acetyltransferase [Woeseiaceae bacterium]
MITTAPKTNVTLRSMMPGDLSQVSDIERRSYDFPWSHGVFRDCLLAGYSCVAVEHEEAVVGYGILSIAAGEAHILNLCIDPSYRSLGLGRKLLDELLSRARDAEVAQVLLEVRPSNTTAIALYRKRGFHKIADRKAYYQAADGREDASVFAKKLNEPS